MVKKFYLKKLIYYFPNKLYYKLTLEIYVSLFWFLVPETSDQ